jgi:transposase-like protein
MKTESKLEPDEINLISLAQEYADEDKARTFLESLRWPNGPVCPHCKSDGKQKPIYTLTPKPTSKRPGRKGLYCCGACRKQFTVLVNTIFSDSHIPISKWLMALFILCSSKKSISAHQLHRMLGITYKTAWFMAHRIRYAMASGPDAPKLTGTVEVDETFIGGKGEGKTRFLRHTPVVALVQRHGPMRTAVVSSVTQKNLGKALSECVSKDAVVNTDESIVYPKPLKEWKKHNTVVHARDEYVRKEADGSLSHVNTCESFFSLLKRGVHGSWHHVSREHLPKYAGEFEFRWNHRKVTDGERMVAAVGTIEGKRLTYRQAI